eukprot:CAMPEP_0168336846 /NCGR_PEP_ID=MMETSP0213-20121227/11804_1 /TAXON_ID=151035 /ORGANISM="Euplotes harpa, Strain FSP1.4" /LENGTH=236 /DNA_ID=CAMNT_0008342155 /DNA_START=273 /DNA_END=980 /DNA_ORIENTATION=-
MQNDTRVEFIIPGPYQALHTSKVQAMNSRVKYKEPKELVKQSRRDKMKSLKTSARQQACSMAQTSDTCKKLRERRFLHQHLRMKAMRSKDCIDAEMLNEHNNLETDTKDETIHNIVKNLKTYGRDEHNDLSLNSSEFHFKQDLKENFNVFKTQQFSVRREQEIRLDSSFDDKLYQDLIGGSNVIIHDLDKKQEVDEGQKSQKLSPKNLKWLISMVQLYRMSKSNNPLNFQDLISLW